MTKAVESFTEQEADSFRGYISAVKGPLVSIVSLAVTEPGGANVAIGDGQALWRVPSTMAGNDLIAVAAALDTAGTGGGFLCQIRRKRSGANTDMLSTRISIDSGENDSKDATTPPVINTSAADITTGDLIYVDIDGVPAGAKGLLVELQFVGS